MDTYETALVTVAPKNRSAAPRSRVELYKLFAEELRLKLLALCGEEELTVGELATLLQESQPQVSRTVAALKAAGLVDARKEGTRTLVRATLPEGDALVADAVREGLRLCLDDGSLARVPAVIAAREAFGLEVFEAQAPRGTVPAQPEHLAHLAALAPLLPGRALAVDVGTGDGLVLDVLAPLYQRVIAVDRSRAQLARVAARIADRGFPQVSLFEGSYDDAALVQRVDALGGADLVFAGRTLHHASRPSQAIAAFARLLKPGGQLVVLDYLPHSDDALRAQGDVWLGLDPQAVLGHFAEAGLSVTGEVPVPDAFHPAGPDAALHWHAWAARKPITPGGTVSPLNRLRS